MTKINAHSLDIKPSQKLSLPVGTKLLTVNVDHRFNKCLLWTLEEEDAPVSEEFTFMMAKLGEEVGAGSYVGTLKDNSGYVHVFAEGQKRPDVVTAAARFEQAVAPVAVANAGEYFDKGTPMKMTSKPVLVEAVK